MASAEGPVRPSGREEELDAEIRFRKLPARTEISASVLLFALSAFHYWTAGFGLLREATHRGIHLAFVLGLVLVVFAPRAADAMRPPRSGLWRPGGISLIDWLLAAIAVAGSLYMPIVFADLALRIGNPNLADLILGTGLILAAIEATRRSIGWGLPLIAILAMVYALFGPWFPGLFLHPGASWASLVNHLYLTSQGIYGVALGVVATYVFHFVLFGVLATRIGLGRLFLGLAAALAGRLAGGPAKISVFGSALFGMISGSSVANTVTVGSLTIPMMVRLGYRRHFAAGVEAAAATGGQVTPPLMGAAAFLMIEFLNTPYVMIAIAAITPAFMHFLGVLAQVHFEAKKTGLRPLEPGDIPRIREVLGAQWPTLAPLAALVVVLFGGYTPYLSAFWGITGCLMLGLARDRRAAAVALVLAIGVAAPTGLLRAPFVNTGLALAAALVMAHGVLSAQDGRTRLLDMTGAFIAGAKYALAVGASAATVGIIVGVVTLTGVGFKFSFAVTALAGQAAEATLAILSFLPVSQAGLLVFFTLVLTAAVCILLGCGVPTTATYIIMVTVAAPALVMLGTEPLVAHFFVFYYGVLADITPPVAIAAYAGASMAGADPVKAGNTAFRLGIGKALVPFAFVYTPSMLLVTANFSLSAFLMGTVSCSLGILFLSAAFAGWLKGPMRPWERWLLGLAALPTVTAKPQIILLSLALAGPVLLRQFIAPQAGEGAGERQPGDSTP